MALTTTPWIPFIATQFLETIVSEEHTIFEYGSGGSTLYFGYRAKHVVSVEHNEEWYNEIKPQLPSNVTYMHIRDQDEDAQLGDDKTNPDHYWSNHKRNFQAYVSAIDTYKDFDIIFIDGRSRPSCLLHAIKKIKKGGWIILDNSDRDYYLQQTRSFFPGAFEHHGKPEWESAEFVGFGPHINWTWKTSFFKKL